MTENNEIIIDKLIFPENIRKRPGKEIGSTENPNVLLREVIDNSIDEIYGCSSCDSIYIITKGLNNWVLVADNGRGIPIKMKEDMGITMTELATCHMDAGSKFNKASIVAIGQNGHGIKATNALSNRFLILSRITEKNYNYSIPEVKDCWERNEDKSNLYYYLYFEKGYKKEEGANKASIIKEKYGIEFPTGMSTITAFQPDDTIFNKTTCEFPSRNLKYLNFISSYHYNKKNISIRINGEPLQDSYEPYKNIFTKKVTKGEYEVTFIVNFEFDTNLNCVEISGSVNSLPVDRGIHIDLIKNAYKKSISDYFGITHGFVLYGIKLNIIVLAGEVDFSSQTKERLTFLSTIYSTEPEVILELEKGFNQIFKDNQEEWEGHIIRLNTFYQTVAKISTIQKIKNTINISSDNMARYKSNMPSNVDDASCPDRSKTELYIVEGQSAGGNMIKARDSQFHAIFYLRGKPMNGVQASLDSLASNREMLAIMSAIGCGVDEYQVVDNPHFNKIIIATDADADGRNIASMLIAFFCARNYALVEKGMLYVVETPLFIQGDKIAYLGDDIDSIIDRSKPYSRIKGLGELDPDELQKYIFNEETRKLVQITMRDYERAISLITSTFARKELMISEGIVRDPYNVGY